MILSIDVGISNLAYCVLQPAAASSADTSAILDWDVVDLTATGGATIAEKFAEAEEDNNNHQPQPVTCNFVNKTQTKKQRIPIFCGKPALYTKHGATICRCNQHTKKDPYLVPTKELTEPYIRKRTLVQLCEMADKYVVPYTLPIKKQRLVETMLTYVAETVFEPVPIVAAPPAPPNAREISLIDVGHHLRHEFDRRFAHIPFGGFDAVVIEQQIGPHAIRMKMMQSMLAMYFVMTGQAQTIQTVSAGNKLKIGSGDVADDAVAAATTTTYKERKARAVSEAIVRCKDSTQWTTVFNAHTKQDDLADCLLQGLWYLGSRGSGNK